MDSWEDLKELTSVYRALGPVGYFALFSMFMLY